MKKGICRFLESRKIRLIYDSGLRFNVWWDCYVNSAKVPHHITPYVDSITNADAENKETIAKMLKDQKAIDAAYCLPVASEYEVSL